MKIKTKIIISLVTIAVLIVIFTVIQQKYAPELTAHQIYNNLNLQPVIPDGSRVGETTARDTFLTENVMKNWSGPILFLVLVLILWAVWSKEIKTLFKDGKETKNEEVTK